MQTFGSESNSKDLIIGQFKREISELKEKLKNYNEVSEKFTNLEFSFQILSNEKKSNEQEQVQRHEQNNKIISQLRSEVDLLSRRLTVEESKNKHTKSSFQDFEKEIDRIRQEKEKEEKQCIVFQETIRELQTELKR